MTIFASIQSWLERRRTIRQLQTLERADADVNRHAFHEFVIKANDAFERDQHDLAVDLFRRGSAAFPAQARESQAGIELLFRLGLFDEVEVLLAGCSQRQKNRAHYLENSATLAYKRGRLEDAVRKSAECRQKVPGSVRAYEIAAAALSELGRPGEADAIMLRGLRAAPNDLPLRVEYGRLAERREDWPEALKRWTQLAAIPDHNAVIIGTVGAARSLRHLQRYGEAEQLLETVVSSANFNLEFWMEFASLPETALDWEEAARRWNTVRLRFPRLALGYVEAARNLLRLDRRIDAEAVLLQGIDLATEDPGPAIEYALIAHHAEEWQTAAQRWATVKDLFPNRREGHELGADALGRITEASTLQAPT